MPTVKDKYKDLCAKTPNIPVFFNPWWMDAVCEKNEWDVIIIEDKEQIKACFVYVLKSVGIWKAIGMPVLTPFSGIWVNYPEGQSDNNRISFEKKVFQQIIDKLPKHDKFFMRINNEITNWLPFYWQGYKETTCYTYVLNNISNLDQIYGAFKDNIVEHIEKAKDSIIVTPSDNIEELYELCKKTFKRQNLKASFSLELIKKIYESAKNNGCAKILLANDKDGKTHAGSLIIWDSKTTYYLLGGVDPDLRSSGANSLLMWETIKFASTVSENFDFEGSMIEGVEKFFRGFGPVQKPYFLITKTNSKFIAIASFIKEFFK